MMAPAKATSAALIDRMPAVRGRIAANAPIGPQTWFRVGGPAEVLFRPADEADLVDFLRALPADIPVTAIGVGSNLLVRDGGIPGVTIRLGRGFAGMWQRAILSAPEPARSISISLSPRRMPGSPGSSFSPGCLAPSEAACG